MSLRVRSKLLFTGSRVAPLGAAVSKRNESSALGTKGTRLEIIRKGTGGRSSFNGVVATIFGASGFLGRYLVNALGKCGTMMVIPYRADPYYVNPLKVAGDLGQVQFHFFNLKDEASVAKAMQHSNVVINLIGKDDETSNFSFNDVHVKGARLIAKLARENGVEKLIHFSALNAVEKPEKMIFGTSKFLATKWEGEQAVREEFPDAIIFRPSDIYGHEDRFVQYYVSEWRYNVCLFPVWKGGRGIFKAPVYVSDVAQAVVKAIYEKGNEGQIYQAVGPRLYELIEILRYYRRIVKRELYFYDMRLDPVFLAKVLFAQQFKLPKVSLERLRREHTTDNINDEIKTIADLGVKLERMEQRFPFELKYYRSWYCEDAVNFRPSDVEPPPALRY